MMSAKMSRVTEEPVNNTVLYLCSHLLVRSLREFTAHQNIQKLALNYRFFPILVAALVGVCVPPGLESSQRSGYFISPLEYS